MDSRGNNMYHLKSFKSVAILFLIISVVLLFQNCSSSFEALTIPSTVSRSSTTKISGSNALIDISRLNANRSILPPQFGTAHASARYNPNGSVQTSFIDGAIDAYNLGFQTLKIWNGPEITKYSFYFLSAEEIAKYSDFSSALNMASFQAVLSIPFKTVVFESDDVTAWTMANNALIQSDQDRIYKSVYDFTIRLRKDFKGSGRTFIIQNHEGDWHIDPTGKPNASNNPNATGLENFKIYWTLRQRAVEDARAAQPSDVNVYHLCEVVRVVPSMQSNQPSLTRDVLPQVSCDLVGYSAYESSLVSNDLFEQALSYIKSKASVSPTFGTNQVAVSEIGLPEQNSSYNSTSKSNMATLITNLIQRPLPYVLFWNLYDNECNLPECATGGGITSNVPLQNLNGYYVRKPDGSLGQIFSQIYSNLLPIASGSELQNSINSIYQQVLGRPADQQGAAAAVKDMQNGGSLIALRGGMAVSSESITNINNLFQTFLNHSPSTAQLQQYEQELATSKTLAQVSAEIQALGSASTLGSTGTWISSTSCNGTTQVVSYTCSGGSGQCSGTQPSGSSTANSPACGYITPNVAIVVMAYKVYLARSSDAPGQAYWVNFLDKNSDLKTLALGFFNSSEFQNAVQAQGDNSSYVKFLYRRLLSREPDTAGLSFWTTALNNGTSKLTVFLNILASPEFKLLHPLLAP